MLNPSYSVWPLPTIPLPSEDHMKFQNSDRSLFPANKLADRNNFKQKKGGGGGSGVDYRTPTLQELQFQNHLKARRFYPKKKVNRVTPLAPRNTSSYIIRAKKSGGIASFVSPCPVTPAILPTPIFSPSREVLIDMAKEEWGVNGYGSMNGLIRLRSPNNDIHDTHDAHVDDEGGSSESDVEEHVEVERRLDHDLSRFEMIYHPNGGCSGGDEQGSLLENRLDDQETHIAKLVEENLTLKERFFLIGRELGDMRKRLQYLEMERRGMVANNEQISENEVGEVVCSEKNAGDGDGD